MPEICPKMIWIQVWSSKSLLYPVVVLGHHQLRTAVVHAAQQGAVAAPCLIRITPDLRFQRGVANWLELINLSSQFQRVPLQLVAPWRPLMAQSPLGMIQLDQWRWIRQVIMTRSLIKIRLWKKRRKSLQTARNRLLRPALTRFQF